MSNDCQTPEICPPVGEIARLRVELQNTNASMERIAGSIEKVTGDHEKRIRVLEVMYQRLAVVGTVLLAVWPVVAKKFGLM